MNLPAGAEIEAWSIIMLPTHPVHTVKRPWPCMKMKYTVVSQSHHNHPRTVELAQYVYWFDCSPARSLYRSIVRSVDHAVVGEPYVNDSNTICCIYENMYGNKIQTKSWYISNTLNNATNKYRKHSGDIPETHGAVRYNGGTNSFQGGVISFMSRGQ